MRYALEHAASEARGGALRPEHFPEPAAAAGPLGVGERVRSLVAEWVRERTATSAAEPADLHQQLLDLVEPTLLDEVLRQLDGNRLAALAEHFLRKFEVANPAGVLPAETLAFLKARPWPGNVRELRNALEHAAIEARGGALRPEHFPEPAAAAGPLGVGERVRSLVAEWVRERTAASAAEPADLHQQLLDLVEPTLLDEVL
ncbi:MAG TPA: hypothetical protein VM529_11850, partial [Gemmata sp.]|nr:hypothetical protein [Gemmata sp.]